MMEIPGYSLFRLRKWWLYINNIAILHQPYTNT